MGPELGRKGPNGPTERRDHSMAGEDAPAAAVQQNGAGEGEQISKKCVGLALVHISQPMQLDQPVMRSLGGLYLCKAPA